MNYNGFDVYERSINIVQTDSKEEIFLAKETSGDFLVMSKLFPGFSGESISGGRFKADLNHDNAMALRNLLPFTAPGRVLGKDRSFGLGDRLGIATPGHIKLFETKDVYPVFAQQSIRELNLTGRSYEDVLDAASFAVFREGFKKEWGADGDHLKTEKDIEYALGLGFTMITLDCSEHIKNNINEENAPPLQEKYIKKYCGKQFDTGEGYVLTFTENELKIIAAIYNEAVEFAVSMYNRYMKDANADFEISIDETLTPTSPAQHYFVARELMDAGVSFATIAPRFCGEFQKGIDYKGDLIQFEEEIKVHAAIARHFNYKLSIHSGSDKFSVFPLIGKECRGKFHVKTAGTNWLEAMSVIAQTEPDLYREVHNYALEAFEEARKYYHVTTDITKIPCLDSLSDSLLPALFENNDARQLIHITYGLILGKKDKNGSFIFRNRLYNNWRHNENVYEEALKKHIGKHLDLLGIKLYK